VRSGPLSLLATVLAASFAPAVAGCGDQAPAEETARATATEPTDPATAEPQAGPGAVDPTLAELSAAADARDPTLLLRAARDGASETRRAALLALARVHGDEAVSGLVAGLRDEDPQARRLAAFGIGALEASAPPEAVAALLGAYAAEPLGEGPPPAPAREPARSLPRKMVWSLARTTDPRAVPALVRALDADGESRIAACRGLAYGPPSGWPEDLLGAAVERAGTDASPAVREACLQGLGRTPLAGSLADRAREHALLALSTPAAPDASEELRVQAARLLGRLPGTDATRAQLARSVADPSWRVGVAAARSLGAHGSGHEDVLAEALRTALGPVLGAGQGPSLTGPRLHVVLAGLEASLDHARSEAIFRLATELVERLDRPTDEPLSRDRGWLHCAAARLHDTGRGWPGRVERCGLDQIGEDERRALAADVLARGQGADPQRAVFLQRLFREGGPRAREAVLAASATLSLDHALSLLCLGLAETDEGVTIAALELVGQLAPIARRERGSTAPAASGARPRLLSELDTLLLGAGARLLAGSSLEGRIALATALEALADPAIAPFPTNLVDLVRPLAAHASHGVRAQALRTLVAISPGDVAPAAPSPPPQPLSPARLALDAREATLVTERGEIVIELFPDVAPTTVTRFVELAESGFFAGLTFHRVVAGFVAQGGDPRGDGYGGPEVWQRCEDRPIAYERGVVGMALAGRDTGGSQFFVTLGPQHHLDGRYTPFGRVREGMDLADALQMGDALTDVRITRD